MRQLEEANIKINQLSLEVEFLRNEHNKLLELIDKNKELVLDAKEVISTIDKTDLLNNREGKERIINRELSQIKGEEFYKSKIYKQYSTSTYTLLDNDIYIGNKKIASIFDDRFLSYIIKVLEIFNDIMTFYVKSVIILEAKVRFNKNIKNLINGEVNE